MEYFFENNRILNPAQYGFRSKLSTIKALENVISTVLESFENKEEVATLLLDLSKAFDLVPHSELIDKLKYYGVEGRELSLLTSYLSDRYQFVKVGDQRSDLQCVRNGVPQGSVLGPFLFVIFVNDLPDFVPNKSILYADDTTLLSSNKDSMLNKVIINYMKERSFLWFDANKLSVNDEKTEEIVFSLSSKVDILEKDCFGTDPPLCGCYVAEEASEDQTKPDAVLIGYAIYYYSYSTWTGKSLFLEDLYVSEKFRGEGLGTKLFKQIAKECISLPLGSPSWSPCTTTACMYMAVTVRIFNDL
ncbi:hypothetical protein J6590_084293 [Homalodisca vitripennis]|nr:hypothetical protein J6590_084293 [Homalodisca vitripennis]